MVAPIMDATLIVENNRLVQKYNKKYLSFWKKIKLDQFLRPQDVFTENDIPCSVCIFIKSFIGQLSTEETRCFMRSYMTLTKKIATIPICHFSVSVIVVHLWILMNKYQKEQEQGIYNLLPSHLLFHFQFNICPLDASSHEKSEVLKIFGKTINLNIRSNLSNAVDFWLNKTKCNEDEKRANTDDDEYEDDQEISIMSGEVVRVIKELKETARVNKKSYCTPRQSANTVNNGLPECALDQFITKLILDNTVAEPVVPLPIIKKASLHVLNTVKICSDESNPYFGQFSTLFNFEACMLCNVSCIRQCAQEMGRFDDRLSEEILSCLHGKGINALHNVLIEFKENSSFSWIFETVSRESFHKHFLTNPMCAYNRQCLRNLRSKTVYLPCLTSLVAILLHRLISATFAELSTHKLFLEKILIDHYLL